jgi:acetyl esterase/lipase
MKRSLLIAVIGCAMAVGPGSGVPLAQEKPKLLTFSKLLARERAKPTERIAYGREPLQFGDLWLPTGPGPHPVVALIHGGCWQAALPGVELMDYMADDLRRRGIAVWNIEYRRIGHPGGGYPGTFQDVAAAVDHLRALAPLRNLDLERVVVSGHSAGGHLASWTAARSRLPRQSPLWRADPLPVRGVVSLAGIVDLAAYRESGPDACGGPKTIDDLVGAPGRERPYADTSPAVLLPRNVPEVVVAGSLDPIVPPRFSRDYAKAGRTAGEPFTLLEIPDAGHFELIDPTSGPGGKVQAEIQRMLR